MRKLIVGSALLCAILLVPSLASAQTRSEFSIGYNALRLFGQDGDSGLTLPAGFYINAAARIGRGVLVVGEIADSTKSETDFGVTSNGSVLTYTGGLRFVSTEGSRRGPRGREAARPFVEILVGGARLSAAVEGETISSGDALAVIPGGGVDIPVNRFAALRLAGHFELYHSGGSEEGFRFDVGLTFRSGRR